jgi:hypothetical protein
MISDLGPRDVHLVCDQRKDLLGVSLNPPRAPVAALRERRQGALIAPAPNQLHCGRGGNSKPIGGGPTAHPASHRRNKAA